MPGQLPLIADREHSMRYRPTYLSRLGRLDELTRLASVPISLPFVSASPFARQAALSITARDDVPPSATDNCVRLDAQGPLTDSLRPDQRLLPWRLLPHATTDSTTTPTKEVNVNCTLPRSDTSTSASRRAAPAVPSQDSAQALVGVLASVEVPLQPSMMTSSRPRDVGSSFASRRGHASQLSISDPSHHVTEAIGTLYGDEDDSGSEGGRPLSFIGGSPYQEHLPRPPQQEDRLSPDPRKPLSRSASEPLDNMLLNGEYGGIKTPLPNRGLGNRSNSFDQNPKSPTLSLRDVQADSSNSPFPLPDIDHPSDIAQELSNLQALRRLSMDVGNNKDPDMPPMSLVAMPAIAPSGDDDENDPSRLLWVPARVHPELAPTEFKSFLEKRVHSIRRRSGDSFLSVGDDSSDSSSGGLRRKKSMLSRQIDNSGGRGAVGYVDGSERLERHRSRGSYQSHELSIDELVKDPTKVVQKLTQDTQGSTGPEGNVDDMPILPVAPGMGLRRSTRTTYRKGGSIRSGERLPFSKRAVNRNHDSESAESGTSSPLEAPKGHGFSRVQSEPLSDNYSRPGHSVRRQHKFSQESLGGFDPFDGASQDSSSTTEVYQDQLPTRTSSTAPVLPIIKTTTAEEADDREDDQLSRPFPQRSSSQKTPDQPVSQVVPEQEQAPDEPPPRSSRRTASRQTVPQSSPQQYTSRSSYPQGQSLNDNLTANPSPVPGGGASRTDNLTFIPTATQEEKKPDKKSKKDRDDDSASVSTTKSSSSAWKWFKSGTDDKEKKKEESKKSKTKSLVEKAHDNVRLDVIQTSIDKNATKGRESLIMERENTDSKLHEERKKESHRKSDSKREKDGNIFSSIFGGSKKKEEKEKLAKKTQHLKVPEEPVYKPLVPDVDYHWTRFPLLEERAIYRMAHIKLANPRRSLLSQVLLSNFMYSYLAIVQAMHPQMNVPLSPQQKRLEEEARRKQQEQEYLAQQQMQEEQDSQDATDHYNFDYHRAAVQYAESGGNDEVDYVDDAQIYEDEHGNDHNNSYDYEGSDGYGQGSKEYYQYHDNEEDRRHDRVDRDDGRDDMW